MSAKKFFEFFFIILFIFNDMYAADLGQYQPSTLLNVAYCNLFNQIISKKITVDEAKAVLPKDLHQPLETLELADHNIDAALLIATIKHPNQASIFIDCGASATINNEIMNEFNIINKSVNNSRKSLQSVFNHTLEALLKVPSDSRNSSDYLNLLNKIQIIMDTGFATFSDKQIKSINDFNDPQLNKILSNYSKLAEDI